MAVISDLLRVGRVKLANYYAYKIFNNTVQYYSITRIFNISTKNRERRKGLQKGRVGPK